MHRYWLKILFLGALSMLPLDVEASPQKANAVRIAYEKSLEAWQIKLQLASTDAERNELLNNRPNAEKAARQMWAFIRRDLDDEWILEPAAWFLKIASGLIRRGENDGQTWVFAKEVARVRKAIREHHIESAKLAPACLAMVLYNNQPSLKLLRQIETTNPYEEVSGVAALGIAMMLKDVGEDQNHRLIRERLAMLRKATVQAAGAVIDGVKVNELIGEELYIINHLTIGRQAPNLVGVDSGNKELSLAQFQDHVVILVFWRVGSVESEGLIEWVKRLQRDNRFKHASFELVGVCSGPLGKLRELQSEGEVTWPNIVDPDGEHATKYRVGVYPLAYVLGPGRKIHYFGNVGTFAELSAAALLEDL